MKRISNIGRGSVRGIVFAVGLVVLFCSPMSGVGAEDRDPALDSPLVHHYFAKSEHKHNADWGYTGKFGPKFWGALSPKYRVAKDGQQQSPINIEVQEVIAQPLPRLMFNYREERISAINNGHSIQHNEKPGSFLNVGDQVYALEQFHVHVPSEHTIDGYPTDMEIHFVHKSSSGEVAVVAVMVYADPNNPVNVPIYLSRELPQEIGERVVADHTSRNPVDLVPTDRSYFTYMGSFTTPPCTEGIRWFVMKTPISIEPEAFAEFKRVIGGNNRPVQKLFGRQVSLSTGMDQPH